MPNAECAICGEELGGFNEFHKDLLCYPCSAEFHDSDVWRCGLCELPKKKCICSALIV